MTTSNSQISVPGLDLRAQYQSIKSEIDEAVASVFESQQFINGPQVRSCEEAIAKYCDCRHAIGVSSGTDALLIALMAEQIGPGDEVITTPYSFFATAGCIARTGATPVFVDIDPVTYNIDASQIVGKISNKTKAIIPVHLFGQMADMDPIMEIASSRNLIVIEDAAQSIGAKYKGRHAGSIGHYGCYSFFPAKNLGCAGDGGMVVTNDEARAERMRVLRSHGSKPKYYHHVIGGNFRLDTLHAAIVEVKLRHLDSWTESRRRVANQYTQLLTESGLVEQGLVTPPAAPESLQLEPVHNQYVIRANRRDELLDHLRGANIATAVYYPRSLHEQECFAHLGYKPDDLPQAKLASETTLALPIYPEVSQEQVAYVVEETNALLRRS